MVNHQVSPPFGDFLSNNLKKANPRKGFISEG